MDYSVDRDGHPLCMRYEHGAKRMVPESALRDLWKCPLCSDLLSGAQATAAKQRLREAMGDRWPMEGVEV